MELNKYQEQAMTTCLPSSNNLAYMFYNLLGEVGELVGKVNAYVESVDLANLESMLDYYSVLSKRIRKQPDDFVSQCELKEFAFHAEQMQKDTLLHKEIGDIEWQLNGFMTVLGLKAEDICQQNLDKLAKRKAEDKIDGNGDNR